MKTYYSEKLGLNYKIKQDFLENRVVVFEDNVNYNDYEMKQLKGHVPKTLKLVHNIKKIFGGVVV